MVPGWGGEGKHREELEPSWLFGVLAQGTGLLCLAEGKELGPWARFHGKGLCPGRVTQG